MEIWMLHFQARHWLLHKIPDANRHATVLLLSGLKLLFHMLYLTISPYMYADYIDICLISAKSRPRNSQCQLADRKSNISIVHVSHRSSLYNHSSHIGVADITWVPSHQDVYA